VIHGYFIFLVIHNRIGAHCSVDGSRAMLQVVRLRVGVTLRTMNFFSLPYPSLSRGSVVGIAAGYRPDDSGVGI
jgi:hypothetical protein